MNVPENAVAVVGLAGRFPGAADVAQFWRSLLPISHYVELQIGQTNYGQPLTAALPQFGALLLFLLPLLLVVRRYQPQAHAARQLATKEPES